MKVNFSIINIMEKVNTLGTMEQIIEDVGRKVTDGE